MSVKKEILLLQRDLGGLITLFFMPLVLIIAVTLIQDSSFRRMGNDKIPILLVDYDKGEVSKKVIGNLNKSDACRIGSQIDAKELT